MLNVVLIVHLILALCLIAVVLLQRSEGGALGIGGGGGGGMVSQRSATTALAKITWALAIAFLCTSLLLTILAQGGGTGSVLERFEAQGDGQVPLPDLNQSVPAEGDLVPPAPAETMPPAQAGGDGDATSE